MVVLESPGVVGGVVLDDVGLRARARLDVCARSRLIFFACPGPTFLSIICVHPLLSSASCCNSAKVAVIGASASRLNSMPLSNCTRTAVFISLGPCSLRMWPSHCSFLRLISRTKSKVRVLLLASKCGVLPVNLAMHRALAPFMRAITFSVMFQASQPYVITLATAV